MCTIHITYICVILLYTVSTYLQDNTMRTLLNTLLCNYCIIQGSPVKELVHMYDHKHIHNIYMHRKEEQLSDIHAFRLVLLLMKSKMMV